MVTKTVAKTAADPPIAFPDAPKREDMQNTLQLYLTAQIAALRKRLRELEDRKPPSLRRVVFVMSEMPVRPVPTRIRDRFYVPDLTVAFDVDESIIIRDNGFAIAHQGGPPVFALEVASKTTGWRRRRCQARRLRGFENRGVLAHRSVRRRVARRRPSRG